MKAITIRGLDAVAASKLKQVAENEKKSVNQLVLDLIKQNIGMQKPKKYAKEYSDLDDLFGSWTDAEFQELQEIVDCQRKIGKPVPTNDIWIAAVAFQNGLKLFTKDAHFKHIPGLFLV